MKKLARSFRRLRGTPTATLTRVHEEWVSVSRVDGTAPEVQHFAPTYWLLGLSVPVKGPDYSTTFLVPVY